jgi:AP-3 complex subunit sigma
MKGSPRPAVNIVNIANMIQAVLIFNNKGLPRLTKFYSTTPSPHLQQLLIAEIFSLVSKRTSGSCNFLEGSKMLGGDDVRIIYRHYATLYFVFVVEESESELGILDLIQVQPPKVLLCPCLDL